MPEIENFDVVILGSNQDRKLLGRESVVDQLIEVGEQLGTSRTVLDLLGKGVSDETATIPRYSDGAQLGGLED